MCFRRALMWLDGRHFVAWMSAGVVAGQLAVSPVGHAQSQIPSWLDAYAAGRHDEVVSAIADDDNSFDAVVRGFEARAEQWVRAEPDQRERRTRVHGVLLLEIVRLTLDRPAQIYGAVRESVERYCSTLREGSPTEFERLWLLASVALLAGARRGVPGGASATPRHCGGTRARAARGRAFS